MRMGGANFLIMHDSSLLGTHGVSSANSSQHAVVIFVLLCMDIGQHLLVETHTIRFVRVRNSRDYSYSV